MSPENVIPETFIEGGITTKAILRTNPLVFNYERCSRKACEFNYDINKKAQFGNGCELTY